MTITELEQWAAGIPGFLDQASNASLLFGWLQCHNLQVTPSNLTAGTRDPKLKFLLAWAPGYEPKPADPRTRAQRAFDAGVLPHEPSQYVQKVEGPHQKLIRETFEAAQAARKQRAKNELRQKELNEIVQDQQTGRVNHARTEEVRRAAAARHAAEDQHEAFMAGKRLPAPPPTVIPLDATADDLKRFDAEQIKNWISRRRANNLPWTI